MVDPHDIPDCIAGPRCRSCGADRTIRVNRRFGRDTTFCIQCGDSWDYESDAPDRRSGGDRRQEAARQKA
jgi:Zn ribbon nucleic-acid-binding protein